MNYREPGMELIPQSITMALGFNQSAFTISALPTAATMMSASFTFKQLNINHSANYTINNTGDIVR